MNHPYHTIRVDCAADICNITLNRPERRNALTTEMVRELTLAFRSAGKSRHGVLVLRSEGEAFCSGLDLAELKSMATNSQEQHRAESEAIATLLRMLYDLPMPTIAAVNGAAIAGGMGLATVCDFTYAVPEAKFGYTEVRIGFVPAIVSAFLLQQIGEKRARDLLLTGRILEAQEAYTLGLVTRIVATGELSSAVDELAQMLLRNSPSSLCATKRLLSQQARAHLDTALSHAVENNAALRETADFREGLTAFLEKRSPRWPSRRC